MKLSVFIHQVIFLFTGLLSTLISQWLSYKKAADSWSLLTVLATYVGMAAIYFTSDYSDSADFIELENIDVEEDSSPKTSLLILIDHQQIALVSTLDVLGNIILTVGLFYVGSGMYQIIYSSIIGWTAINNRVFLKRSINYGQWASVILIILGLGINGIVSDSTHTETDSQSSKFVFDFAFTLVGTIIYSWVE